jgi:hypothetical protein
MDHTPAEYLSREEGLALHVRLCDQDPTAVADVCRAYLRPLLAWLAARYPRLDPDLRQTSAHDALIAYVRTPHAYDPSRMELGAYLRMAARGDLLNLYGRERKHQKGRVGLAVVEDEGADGNLIGEEDPSLQLEAAEEAGRRRYVLRAVMEGFGEAERRVLELMLAGERKTAAYATALGVERLPVHEQEREVKKVKDRIKKRVQRGVPRHG